MYTTYVYYICICIYIYIYICIYIYIPLCSRHAASAFELTHISARPSPLASRTENIIVLLVVLLVLLE